MEPNVYSDPEKFGLTIVGEIAWYHTYDYDMTVVWRRGSDGALFYGDDSGCSCGWPFDSVGLNDIVPAAIAQIDEHLKMRARERIETIDYDDSPEKDGWQFQIANIMERLVMPRVA